MRHEAKREETLSAALRDARPGDEVRAEVNGFSTTFEVLEGGGVRVVESDPIPRVQRKVPH